MKTFVTIAVAAALAAGNAAAQDTPKGGVYLGYDYVRFNSATNVPAFSANGGGGQFVFNFNHWLSGVADLGAVHNGNISGVQLDTTIANYLFGPRLTFSHRSRFQPYLQILWGGAYATSSIPVTGVEVNPPGQEVSLRLRASETGFAMTVGGGLDIRISRHVTFRPIGLDYYLTRLQNLRTMGDNNQSSLRYSSGFTFWFGGEKAAPPQANRQVAMKNCPDGTSIPADSACPKANLSVALTATPSELCPGQTAQLTPSISGGTPTQLSEVSYAWSVNGEQVSQSRSYEFNSAGRDPGTYRVSLSTGGDAFNPSSAEASVTVREYRPPTGMVQASPTEIRAGDKSSLSANFQGQCGGPIQSLGYQASEGAVNGEQFDSSSIRWDASNNAEQRKTVTITAKAADSQNTGMATTTIDVVRPAAPAVAVRLPDVLFPANNSRVNNCGKRILLEQLRSYYERDSGGTVVVVGHSSSDETTPDLAQKRAMNAAAVVTAGAGICLAIPQSQVEISAPGPEQNGVSFEAGFCQSSVVPVSSQTEMRRVEVWFVPKGGQLPASVTNNQPASAMSVSGLGCPK